MIVDDRREQDTYYGLMNKGILDIEVKRIEVADVLLDDGYAIERKGHDLIASLTSGRIWEQLINLNEYEHPILCIVNDNIWRDFYFCKSNWIHNSYKGFLTTLATSYPKLKSFYFTKMEDYIDFIISLDKKIHKEGTSTRPTPIHRRTKKITIRMEDSVAMAEGISIGKSKKLLEHFGSVNAIANASVEDIKSIPGFAEKTAQKIYDLFNNEYK